MGTKKVEFETKVALDTGFYGSRRITRGDTFQAPVDETGKWFRPASDTDRETVQALSGEPALLDKPIPEIMAEFPKLSVADLRTLKGNELTGKTRKGLIAKIDDEIANRTLNGEPGDDLLN